MDLLVAANMEIESSPSVAADDDNMPVLPCMATDDMPVLTCFDNLHSSDLPDLNHDFHVLKPFDANNNDDDDIPSLECEDELFKGSDVIGCPDISLEEVGEAKVVEQPQCSSQVPPDGLCAGSTSGKSRTTRQLMLQMQNLETILNVRVAVRRLSQRDVEFMKNLQAKRARKQLKTVHLKKAIGETSGAASAYTCRICRRRFAKSWVLNRHMGNSKCKSKAAKPKLKCHLCGKEVAHKGALRRHVGQALCKRLQNRRKDEDKTTKKKMLTFLRSGLWYREVGVLRCGDCGMYFCGRKYLRQHRSACEYKRALKCVVCAKSVSNPYYIRHLRMHFNANDAKGPCARGNLSAKKAVGLLNSRLA